MNFEHLQIRDRILVNSRKNMKRKRNIPAQMPMVRMIGHKRRSAESGL